MTVQANVERQAEPQGRSLTDADPSADAMPPWAPAGGSTLRPRRRLGLHSAATILLALAGFVAVAGVAFAVGRTTAGAQGTAATQGANGISGAGGQGQAAPEGSGPGGGTQVVQGTVTAIDGETLTLTLSDGQTVQIATGSSTAYHSQETASSDDVAIGSSVVIQVSGLGGPPGTSSAATATDVIVAGE